MAELEGPVRWGLGQLYVESTPRVFRFRAWPNPGAWAGIDRKSCRTPLEPAVGLEDFLREARRRHGEEARAFDAFVETLPAPVRDVVDPFPAHLFSVLQLIWNAREPAMELLSDNPALTLAVALSPKLKMELSGDGWKSPDELVRLKRTEIVKWLEFPGGKSTVRILGRVTRHALSLPHLRTLRRLLIENDGTTRKRLNHIERINPEVLAILSKPRLAQHVTTNFLEEASEMRLFEPFTARRLEQVLDGLSESRPDQPLPTVDHIDDLESMETELWRDGVRLRLQETRSKMRLPEPPVAGNGNIEPIDSAVELFMESQLQKNCAASYYHQVKLGRSYLYRMARPERCTIELIKCLDGSWALGQIKARYNLDPQSPATMRIVRRWLDDHGCGIRMKGNFL